MKLFLLVAFISIAYSVRAQEDSLKTIDLGEVVVSGQYRPQSLKRSVYQVRVIGAELLKANGATSIQQVLAAQLGFRFSQDPALGVADVQLMGMSGRNVKIMLDGVPLVDRGDIRESLGQVDINQIERIEIVEGPLSVIYGTDALAGVINLISKKPTKQSVSISANVLEETAGSEYHPFSYKGLHRQSIQMGLTKSKFGFSGGVTHYQFSGWGGDVYGRDKVWLPKEQWMSFFRVGFTNKKFSTYYRVDILDELIKDRGPINLNNYRSLDRRYFTDRQMHQVQADWPISEKFQWNGLMSFTDYERRTRTTRHNFETGEDDLSTATGEQDVSGIQSYLVRNTLVWKISNKWTIQPGLEYQHEIANGDRIAGQPSFGEISGFISGEWSPIKTLKLRGGVRSIHHSDYDAPLFIPSLNAKIQLGQKTSVRTSIARGFRSPSLRELYFDFRDANHHIIGNSDLKAENSMSVTGGLVHDWIESPVKAKTTVFVFYNKYNNLITFAQHPTDPQVFTTVNLDSYRSTGLTVENSFINNNWQVGFGLSVLGLYNIYADGKNPLGEDLPDFTWSPEANFNAIYKLPKYHMTLNLVYKFAGSRPGYRLGVNPQTSEEEIYQVRLSSFHLGDFFIQKSIFKKLEMSAGVRNLFDVTSIKNSAVGSSVHGSEGPQLVGYGRSYSLGLSFKLNQ